MQQVSVTEFRSVNWLPTKEELHQCINAITFRFVKNDCPFYLNHIFEFAPHCRIDTRNSFVKLEHAFRKTTTGQKTLSNLGLFAELSTRTHKKKTNNLNTFKHNAKNLYLNQQTDTTVTTII